MKTTGSSGKSPRGGPPRRRLDGCLLTIAPTAERPLQRNLVEGLQLAILGHPSTNYRFEPIPPLVAHLPPLPRCRDASLRCAVLHHPFALTPAPMSACQCVRVPHPLS